MDVGMHTGVTSPNTSLEVVKAVMHFFTNDKELVDLILLDTKMEYLYDLVVENGKSK